MTTAQLKLLHGKLVCARPLGWDDAAADDCTHHPIAGCHPRCPKRTPNPKTRFHPYWDTDPYEEPTDPVTGILYVRRKPAGIRTKAHTSYEVRLAKAGYIFADPATIEPVLPQKKTRQSGGVMARRRPDLPTISNPNTSRVRRNRKGKVVQRRYYGGDGRAVKNVDFEAHHGAPNPHVHDWDWTKDPPRQPPRLPKKGEQL